MEHAYKIGDARTSTTIHQKQEEKEKEGAEKEPAKTTEKDTVKATNQEKTEGEQDIVRKVLQTQTTLSGSSAGTDTTTNI